MQSLREFGFLLKDISRLFSRNFERHAARLHLTLNECRVLGHLERNEGISQARLAYLTETDPMTLGRILKRMEEMGLVERRPTPDDRRCLSLYLRTPALPLLKNVWRLSDRSIEETLAGISDADRTQLVTLMNRIHANLDALVPGIADRGGTSSPRRERGPRAGKRRAPRRTRAMRAKT